MSVLNVVFTLLMISAACMIAYGIVMWLVVFIVRHRDREKRKKYAVICAVSMLALAVLTFIGFAIGIAGNTR